MAKDTFSADEKAAIKQASAERKRTKAGKNGEADVLAAIDKMDDFDRPIAQHLHALVAKVLPQLTCKTWYGFPAYMNDAGKIVFYYQFASKFKGRYGMLGFQDPAHLDEGHLWPVTYAITEWNKTVEKQVTDLITRAVG